MQEIFWKISQHWGIIFELVLYAKLPLIFFISRLALDGVEEFYSDSVTLGNGTALVFINITLLQAQVDAEELHMDATFDSIPRQFYQLATLHAIAYGHVMNVTHFFSLKALMLFCILNITDFPLFSVVCRCIHPDDKKNGSVIRGCTSARHCKMR